MEKIYSETIPIQYEEGKANFLGMDIMVDSRVFIPRPETELLVRAARELCKENEEWLNPFILDLGTGSGAISLALAKLIPASRIVASDISLRALEVARENIKRFNCEDTIELIESDMFSAFSARKDFYKFNCIVSNPPYISRRDYEKLDPWVKAEPAEALYGGEDGMDCLNKLVQRSSDFLTPDGFIALEIGYDQSEKVKEIFQKCGFINIKSFRDFNGFQRVIVGEKNG